MTIARAFDESFNLVQGQVAKFRRDPQHYLSSTYNEAQARQDFIDEFWRELPIPHVRMEDGSDKARHDRMVQLVEQMLAAKQQLAQSQTDRDKAFYENKCTALDRQIDQLVYELYNLIDEDIAIIDAAR